MMKHTTKLARLVACLALMMTAYWASAATITVNYVDSSGDNLTTDVTSINSALSVLLPDLYSHYAGTIDLNGGTWSLSDDLPLYTDQTITNGELLATSSMNNQAMIKIFGDNTCIHDIILDRDITAVPATLGSGIDINGHSNCTIDGVQIYRQNSGILSGSTTAPAQYVHISNVYISLLKGCGIGLGSANWPVHGFTLDECQIEYANDNGINLQTQDTTSASSIESGANMARISNVRVRYCNGDGMNLNGNNITVRNCQIEGVAGHGIELGDCKYINISENNISGAGTTVAMPSTGNFSESTAYKGWGVDYSTMTSGKAGIFLDETAENVNVSNNEVFYNASYGIYGSLFDSNSGTHIMNWNISDNNCHTNGQYSGTGGVGIYLLQWYYGVYKSIRLIGNRCYNDQGIASASPQTYGFEIIYNISTGFSNCISANNDFTDSAQSNTTTMTGWTFDNNLN